MTQQAFGQRTHPIHALKFAPDDQYLAVCSGFWIDVYDVAGTKPKWALCATLKGHTAVVTEIDW